MKEQLIALPSSLVCGFPEGKVEVCLGHCCVSCIIHHRARHRGSWEILQVGGCMSVNIPVSISMRTGVEFPLQEKWKWGTSLGLS